MTSTCVLLGFIITFFESYFRQSENIVGMMFTALLFQPKYLSNYRPSWKNSLDSSVFFYLDVIVLVSTVTDYPYVCFSNAGFSDSV